MFEELQLRKKRTQKLMKENGLDGLLILQYVDLFYYTNSMQTLAAYIPNEGEILVFFKRAEKRIKENCPLKIYQTKSIKNIPEILKENSYAVPENIGLEFDVLPVSLFNYVNKVFSGVNLTDASQLIKNVRMIKSEFEISEFKKCGEAVKNVYNSITGMIKENMSELELSKEIEYLFRQNSHLGPSRLRGFNLESFFGHVLSGTHALVPASLELTLGGEGAHPAYSAGASSKKIKKGEPVVIDYIFNYNGYQIDTTRIYSLGEPSKEILNYHEKLLDIYATVKSLLKPGNTCEDIYNAVIEKVAELGLTDNFMGYGEERVKFIGHGIGLEVDEFPPIAPRVKTVLEENMALALEPKLFFPDFGCVGIEDTMLITKDGPMPFAVLSEEIFIS